jgi:hypothetical protein
LLGLFTILFGRRPIWRKGPFYKFIYTPVATFRNRKAPFYKFIYTPVATFRTSNAPFLSLFYTLCRLSEAVMLRSISLFYTPVPDSRNRKKSVILLELPLEDVFFFFFFCSQFSLRRTFWEIHAIFIFFETPLPDFLNTEKAIMLLGLSF